VITLRGVRRSFGDHAVLDGVDLDVLPGETLVIIGRSGTGKSVTLRHIIGLLDPDEGEVHVFGRDLARMSARELKAMRLRIGYLFQSGALINWLTIAENVALPLLEHSPGLAPAAVEAKVMEKLRLVEMEDAARKYPPEVSGGMKKRGGLARAIVLEPEVILYDEPTSGLDPVMASAINELVIHTREVLGVSQVVVTHDMESAYRIADRIAMLYEGKIIAAGTPAEIRGHPDPVVQQFITGNARGPITDRV
jgi:phospholipid/cholesterol/gamma-HCH transport system ATP-binding protein